MDFRIVLHGELGKGVAVGIFNKQELAAFAAALNDSLRLIGVEKYSVLVASIKIFALIDAIRFIIAAVVGHISVCVFVPCRDLFGRDGRQRNFIPSCTVEIIAEYFLRPFARRRLNTAPRTVGIVGPKARPMMVGTVIDALAAI